MSESPSISTLKQIVPPLVIFSGVTNLSVLISPIFMMQVLDRVVPSGNLNTLLLLLLVAIVAIALQTVVEMMRDTVLERTSRWVEATGAQQVLQKTVQERETIVTDIGVLSGFLQTGPASVALNLPWVPLFVIALALIHPFFLLLVSSLVGLMFVSKWVLSSVVSGSISTVLSIQKTETQTLVDACDVKFISGMSAVASNLAKRFLLLQAKRHGLQNQSSTVLNFQKNFLVFLRSSAQLLALSLGAYLVVVGELTAGGMIGASILCAKSISTVEGCINNFPQIQAARKAFGNLKVIHHSSGIVPIETDDLAGKLSCKGLIYPRGGGAMPRLDRISFDLIPGECLAIVGASGGGKSTLLQVLSGIDSCPIGSVLYDETEVKTLGSITRESSIGYLSQKTELNRGTIVENISCFEEAPEDEKVIAAAKLAGVHGLISALPHSYQTDIAENANLLSAGQQQRIALARAIYQNPKYLFLDEPNALLDSLGERQLCDTLANLKKSGVTIVMVLHRPGIMGLADKVMVLDQGRMIDFGSRSEVMARQNDNKQRITLPLLPTSLLDLSDWIIAQFARHSDASFCNKAVLVANEMFNASFLNGPNGAARQATFVFKFVDEYHCELLLREEVPTKAVEKMNKIRSLIKHPEVSMVDLKEDEIALAVIAQMADVLDIKNEEKSSVFSAQLSSDEVKLNNVVNLQ